MKSELALLMVGLNALYDSMYSDAEYGAGAGVCVGYGDGAGLCGKYGEGA